MILTRPEYIIKQTTAIWGVSKLIGESGDTLDGTELEGVSTALFHTIRVLENACYELIPGEDDTKEDLERKLIESKLIVSKIENAIKELDQDNE